MRHHAAERFIDMTHAAMEQIAAWQERR